MPTYRFSGKISLGRGENPFEREVEAESLKHARETLYSSLGGEHSVSRSKIQIEDEEEV